MMNVVMSIDKYKRYKNGELNLVKVKMNNMGINKDKTVNWIIQNKTLLVNVAFFSLLLMPTNDVKDSIYENMLKLVEEAYKTQNPKQYIELFFTRGWMGMFKNL